METGPRTEAFAVGVIAAHPTQAPRNWFTTALSVGLDSIVGWAGTGHRPSTNAELRATLRVGVKAPMRSKDVATEMLATYRQLVGQRGLAAEA
jgi:hypothetical protein